MCRGVFEIPEVQASTTEIAASALPVNRFASTALTTVVTDAAAAVSFFAMSKGDADPNDVLCEGCEETQSVEYCLECCQPFCGTCKKIHLRTRGTALHQLVSLDDLGRSADGGVVSRIARCEKHPRQEINTYCHKDKQAICLECVVDFHQEHKVERLSNVVQGFKVEISQLVNKVCSFFFLLFSTIFSDDWRFQ